jgi:hypothetical protein
MLLRYEWKRSQEVIDFSCGSLEMVQRCGGDTYEQWESRRGEEVRKWTDIPLQYHYHS